MSVGIPTSANGTPFRAAAFHDMTFRTYLMDYRGEYETKGAHGGEWWPDLPLEIDAILEHQNIPPEARKVFLAMVGACLFDIGERLPHPYFPDDRTRDLLNRLEVILFIWGRAGTGKSTLLKMISAMFNDNPDLVGVLENESSERFGLQKVRTSKLVIAPDIDSRFNISPTTLTAMTSGESTLLLAIAHCIDKALVDAGDAQAQCRGRLPDFDHQAPVF